MIMNPERRLFLRGGKPLPIRPPWALAENEFLKRCTRCGTCLTSCPQQIIDTDLLGYPKLNFAKGGCIFCGACVQQCPVQALTIVTRGLPWQHKAFFSEACLNGQGIPCRTCGEQCDTSAIIFQPSPGGRILPQLVTEQCNGCGACYAVCPVQAIRMIA